MVLSYNVVLVQEYFDGHLKYWIVVDNLLMLDVMDFIAMKRVDEANLIVNKCVSIVTRKDAVILHKYIYINMSIS